MLTSIFRFATLQRCIMFGRVKSFSLQQVTAEAAGGGFRANSNRRVARQNGRCPSWRCRTPARSAALKAGCGPPLWDEGVAPIQRGDTSYYVNKVIDLKDRDIANRS
jgi:hypothetical protein